MPYSQRCTKNWEKFSVFILRVSFITLKIEGTGYVETASLYSKLHVVASQETVLFNLKADSSWLAMHLYEPGR